MREEGHENTAVLSLVPPAAPTERLLSRCRGPSWTNIGPAELHRVYTGLAQDVNKEILVDTVF